LYQLTPIVIDVLRIRQIYNNCTDSVAQPILDCYSLGLRESSLSAQ